MLNYQRVSINIMDGFSRSSLAGSGVWCRSGRRKENPISLLIMGHIWGMIDGCG